MFPHNIINKLSHGLCSHIIINKLSISTFFPPWLEGFLLLVEGGLGAFRFVFEQTYAYQQISTTRIEVLAVKHTACVNQNKHHALRKQVVYQNQARRQNSTLLPKMKF